ncbi:hypothetical protein G3578_03685 [Brevibacillus sp. SYP-B805]|uniref:hypothetical protein n=1 Tax=Brevibacillus sp. SYP-B805 TaxID=1578199 RepID=UPI0013EA1BDD|nr:hypothetical protein [Brevibacillus sp. SYP-B805]NGQ94275.1 hypothetical protein [Brevibacillus sp. SYP-B805]
MFRGLMCALVFLLAFPVTASAFPQQLVTITVAASSKSAFSTTLTVEDSGRLAKQILRSPARKTSQKPELPRAKIAIGKKRFVYDSLSRLFEPSHSRMILLSGTVSRELEHWVTAAEQKHFGRFLAWELVRKDFHRMSYADVIDLETGQRFRVQRRAGSRHADVQPLTKEDTRIMKGIYQGKWSWKRRAILVKVGNNCYAASMHGMPHGAGAIKGNDFPGHFCIHFAGSTTHRRNVPDPSHSLMILKAAGKLPQQLMTAEPHMLVEYFLTAAREQDTAILDMMTDGAALPFRPDEIFWLTRVGGETDPDDVHLVTAKIPVRVSYLTKEGGERKETWLFHLERSSFLERWKITGITRGEKADD